MLPEVSINLYKKDREGFSPMVFALDRFHCTTVELINSDPQVGQNI